MMTRLIFSFILILAASLVQAQEPDQAELDNLRQELEQAREDMAEAAQRMARLQRELVQSGSNAHGWVWQGEDGEMRELDFDFNFEGDQVRHMVLAGFPPRLGVLLGDPDDGQGNQVVGVTPGGGAEEAGIRKDDRLISVGGRNVTENTASRIREVLAEAEPGDSVDVVIQRGEGTELIMPVVVGSALSDLNKLGERLAPMMENIEREIIRVHPGGEGMPEPPMPPMPPRLAGLGHDTDLISNHAGLESYFGTSEGVLVLRIADDNPLNLESGDVILSIDGEAVSRPVDLGRILLSREAGDQVTVEVMRNRLPTEVSGTIPDQPARAPGARRTGMIIHGEHPEPPPAPSAPGSVL